MPLSLSGDGAITGMVSANSSDLSTALAAKAASSSVKIIQVVSATYATAVASTSTTYADTGLTATITPASTSNKILVMVSQPLRVFRSGAPSAAGALRILRGATVVWEPNGGADYGSQIQAPSGDVGRRTLWTASFIDSPASTSALTYKTQIAAASGSTATASENSQVAQIILMEVAA